MTEYSAANQALPTHTADLNPPPPEQAQIQKDHDSVHGEHDQAAVTSPKLAGSVARVEYRDQLGNILPEDVVASLRAEGKVKFETRFESRSRLENAHEIPIVDGQLAPPHAPPHPDVEGQNPETGGKVQDSVPPESPASVVQGNEQSAEKSSSLEAKPASEGNEATK